MGEIECMGEGGVSPSRSLLREAYKALDWAF